MTRWSPGRFAWRSAVGHRRGQTVVLLAVSALITACTTFAPVYDRAMQQALVDTLLAGVGTEGRTVTVESAALSFARGATEARDPRELQDMVPAELSATLDPFVLGRTAVVTPVTGAVPPSGRLVWRDGACEHVRVLAGTCPDAPGEIMVSEADADTFDLSPGATTTVASESDGPEVPLEVVGTYAPADDSWWQGLDLVGHSLVSRAADPSAAHDAWLTAEETFVRSPVLPAETAQAAAVVPTPETGVEEVLRLGDGVRQLNRDLRGEGQDLHVRTDLGDLADDVRGQASQAHRTVPLLMAPMAVLTLFVLWLVLSAATRQRRGEVAVARLRGRGPVGASALLLVELLPVLLAGVVPGVALALAGGGLARSLLPGEAPFEAGPGFATAVVLSVLAIVLTALAATARVAREPLDDLVRSGPTPSRRWTLGAPDAVLVAVAGTGAVAFVAGGLSGSFALAGPALLALFVGLVAGHVAAPVASTVGRRLLDRGRLVAGLGLLETGRRRDTRAVITVITVACALAVFSLDALAVGARNRANAAEHDAGAPVVLQLGGGDLDGVRAALADADPGGRRATPVVVAGGTTLAVEPDGFRRIAFFPRGAPSAAEWRAIAPPAAAPVRLAGSRISIDVASGPELTSQDVLGSASELRLNLVVTTATGVRRTIQLGEVPEAGRRATLAGREPACADGCLLAALELSAAQGVQVVGDLDLSGLRVDGTPVALGTSAEDWNPTDDDHTAISPAVTASGALRLVMSIRGFYPAHVTPAWVPLSVAAVLPAGRDPLGLVVTALDGGDRAAHAAGDVVLVPSLPRRSALVDLDAISRGAEVTVDSSSEVWMVDDPALLSTVEAALRDRGIGITGVRRSSEARQAYADSVATWSLALGAVVGPAVLLVSLLVLLVLAATGWRAIARNLAILRLNGARRRTTTRLGVLAQLPSLLLAVAAGVAAGTAGAAVAMPDVSFLPEPPSTPVLDTATAWPAVLWAAAACAVVLPTVAAVASWVVARRAHLERVKEVV
ncbi:FtsX-like permease family protein [Nocardioides sp.]|uniref:FtsX-like permease family protein n=1 Tax=Nocardioides sp. TaxID=35761 RepID=UPI0035AF236F